MIYLFRKSKIIKSPCIQLFKYLQVVFFKSVGRYVSTECEIAKADKSYPLIGTETC